MTIWKRNKTLCGGLLLLLILSTPAFAEVVLEKTISREHPLFENRGKFLNVGRDGKVYLGAGHYLVRMNRDGSQKVGLQVGRGQQAVATDAQGNFAVADSPHRGRQVILMSPTFEPLGSVGGFLSGEHLNWGSPCDLQSGESGDFYAMDQHHNRILRIALPGKTVAEYSLQGTGENFVDTEPFFRVVESLKRFYIAGHRRIHALGFDGQQLWTIDTVLTASQDVFDADDEGNLYILNGETNTIKVYGPDGKPRNPIALQMADISGGRRQQAYVSLKVLDDEILLKRHRVAHATEMFRVYNRQTGALKRIIHIDAEVVKAEFPSTIWTAGESLPVNITLTSGGKTVRPNWPVQIAMCNDSQWIDLPVKDGKVTPPADASGLYVVRVGYGDFKLEEVVEIRRPGSKGSVNILTPLNRVYYGRGEEIPVTVIVRGPKPQQLKLELRKDGARVWSTDVNFASANSATISLPTDFTAALRPGKYLLTTDVPAMTVASQPLVIGPGLRQRPTFNIVQGGDGGGVTAEGNAYDAPSAVESYVSNAQRLGTNLIMSRVGYMKLTQPTGLEAVEKRLAKDPLGVAPEKARVENMALQTVAAHGAFGLEQQMILLHMDSMVPFLPEGQPSPGGMLARSHMSTQRKIVEDFSRLLLPYPAFRGWSWACNWWIDMVPALRQPTEEAGAKLVRSIEKKFETALEKTGRWNPEFETLSAPWVNAIPDTERNLNEALQGVAPGKINAATGPYRQPWVIPPITFRGAKEVDLFLQAEQIQPPYTTPHNVDFYKRPGKRAWGHVDAGGEDGLGYMAPPIILMQAMRGADGTGWEGPFKPRPSGRRGMSTTGMDNDVRSTGQGGVSILRALGAMLQQYGPWMTTLEGSDPIAIVVSTRMLRVDSWSHGVAGAGLYFNRLFEAYTACLFAHRPAVFVFVEDLQPGILDKFKAVLVVGQRLELDPPLAKALAAARDSGVRVYFDGTCREEHVRQFDALNVAFDQLEHAGHQMNDDSAYWRIPRLYKDHAAKLAQSLGNVVPTVAGVNNAEIMLTERRRGEGRFVWVLNNDLPDWEPGMLWRVANFSTSRVGQQVPIDLHANGQTVYDLFAQKEVKGNVVADLRQLPARIFAVLPKPIESVQLSAPGKVKAGDSFSWKVAINGPKTSYPLRLRLTDSAGSLIEELVPNETEGKLTAPLNATSKVMLEATELISGKQARQTIEISGISISDPATTKTVAEGTLPVENLYGPHLRDIAVSTDGSSALINAMNWEENYYLLDTHTGAVRTQGNVGHQFAYGPVATSSGFFVQGYDVTTGEGYHLYDLEADGKPTRRFALYGLPDRWQSWRAAGILTDRVNNFVVSSNGDWIATASNLGLIVWDKTGKKLWSQDWWKEKRREVFLLRPDDKTLITLADMAATAYQAQTSKKLWEVKLGETGLLEGGTASADGRTVAAYSHVDSGRVFVLRDGKLINTFMVMADNVYLSPDGRHLLMAVGGDELRWYTTDGGLEWTFRGNDYLIGPRISADGKKIAVGDHSGTLYVLDDHGQKLFARDFGAVPMAAWLDGGELLVATWMGKVARLDAKGVEKWHVHLKPRTPSRLASEPVAESLPTLKPQWGNSLSKPAALTPNLLAGRDATFRLTQAHAPFRDQGLRTPTDLLIDGQAKAPAEPWLSWTSLHGLDFFKAALEVDAKQRLRVTGVTFVEDPTHPESWLRDMRIQAWDPVSAKWIDGPYLLSDAAVHTHMFEKPLEGTKFRFIGTGDMLQEWRWPMGNIRLGEVVFHGEAL